MNYIRKIASININALEIASKKHLLKDFVIASDLDIVFIQEVHFENFSFLPQYAAYVNISDTRKGTAILVRKSLGPARPLFDPSGRIISIEIGDINFINVYGHSGSQYRTDRDDLFRNKIAVHLNKATAKNHVLGGDFNCIVDGKDTKNRANNVCHGLRSLVGLFNLRDLELECNGSSNRKFTFVRNESASRFILI